MLIIQDQTEQKLVQKLEFIRQKQIQQRCMYFALEQLEVAGGWDVDAFLQLLSKIIPSLNAQAYYCRDGSLFILTPDIRKEHLGKVHVLLDHHGFELPEQNIHLYDLSVHVSSVLANVQDKLDSIEANQKKMAAESARLVEQERVQRILSHEPSASQIDAIAARRDGHEMPHILIVEDDVFSGRLVAKSLNKNYQVTHVKDGVSSLTSYPNLAPHTVFLDINLPDISGHDLITKYLEMDPDAYIVMLSGNGDKANVMRAIELGAKGFVAKPFAKEKLEQYIQKCPSLFPDIPQTG